MFSFPAPCSIRSTVQKGEEPDPTPAHLHLQLQTFIPKLNLITRAPTSATEKFLISRFRCLQPKQASPNSSSLDGNRNSRASGPRRGRGEKRYVFRHLKLYTANDLRTLSSQNCRLILHTSAAAGSPRGVAHGHGRWMAKESEIFGAEKMTG